MNRSPLFWSSAPLLAWTRLALNTSEMLAASAQVIQHRTQRIAQAGPAPNARDRKEFRLMGQEKFEAASESFQAVGWRMLQTNQMLTSLLFKQWTSWMTSTTSLVGLPFWLWSGKEYQQWVNRAQGNASVLGNQLSNATAQLASHGLKPVHARATANARRLLK